MKILMTTAFVLCRAIAFAQTEETYPVHVDAKRQPGVPTGTVTTEFIKSELYGSFRNYYVYVPAQYKPGEPAAIMVFQDGHFYVNEEGAMKTTIVFDNLIHKKKMPVTIGLFVNPGHDSEDFPANLFRSKHRIDEYDELSDRYARFLIEELIPEVAKKYTLSTDARMHAIAGLSSGGICAFTAAWQRPDYFHKVMSHSGSFTNIRGGHQYPSMIRGNAKKDIKVFLQCGTNDLDNIFGDWWLANKQMESALRFRGYDYTFVAGTGAHNGKHGGAILPESLTWLWSDVMEKK